MNAPLSAAARLAIRQVSGLPVGFLDEGDNPVIVMDQWHQSFEMNRFPAASTAATEVGKRGAAEALAACRAMSKDVSKNGVIKGDRRKVEEQICWRDTPRSHRIILVRLAGLDPELVDQLDRNLSESEKCHIREAAAALRDSTASLLRVLS